MVEGKVTLTCGHTNETPVNIWEPDIDRQGQRCRSYSTYCPACAEASSLAMVERIEALEAEVAKAREEGRRAGLEEAAKECDRIAGETRMAYSSERRRGAGMCAAMIRALAQTSTPQEGEE